MTAPPPHLLFVCLGNICRSPLMQGLAETRWQPRAATVRIDSAGLGDWHAGEPPDPRAIAVAREHGVDIAGQRARRVCAEDFLRFDLILCADRSVLEAMRRRAPRGGAAECALFLDWTGVQAAGEVPDPYTGGAREFAQVFALIDRGARALAERLR